MAKAKSWEDRVVDVLESLQRQNDELRSHVVDLQRAVTMLAAQANPEEASKRKNERARLGALAKTAGRYGMGRFEWLAFCDAMQLDPRKGTYDKRWVALQAHELRLRGVIPNDEQLHDLDR